jgi:hypothetical protein
MSYAENDTGQTRQSKIERIPSRRRAKVRLPRQLKFIYNIDDPLDVIIKQQDSRKGAEGME